MGKTRRRLPPLCELVSNQDSVVNDRMNLRELPRNVVFGA